MIKSRTQKSKSLIQQLWFERAEKVMSQLRHLGLLIDQFEYMGEIANKLSQETTSEMKKSFKEERDQALKE